MGRILGIITAILILSFCSYAASEFDNLKIMTEEYPPYNFSQNGAVVGISADLLEEVLKNLGSKLTKKDMELLPWARGYSTTQSEKNTMLFSMTQTPAREKLFKFAGPIIDTKVVLLAKKGGKIQINSPEDINKYAVGTILEDIGEQLLAEKGVAKKNIQPVSKGDLNVKKLSQGRIDAWAYEENVAKWMIKKEGLNPDDYESVYTLGQGVLSYAFSKDISDAQLAKFQAELDKVKKSPKYKEILAKYLK